jgi:hypothetical protein
MSTRRLTLIVVLLTLVLGALVGTWVLARYDA